MESDLSLSSIKTFLVISAGLLFLAAPETNAQEVRDSLGKQLSPISSAIVRTNQAAEKELNLIARVEVQPDEILEFYEPSPGFLLISSAGAPKSMTPLDKRRGSPADVWRRATAGAEMPATLREAIERVGKHKRARTNQTPRKNPGKWGGGSPSRDFTRSGGYCDGAYHSELGGCGVGWDFMVCLTNWWDGAYAYHHDAEITYTVVCPASGRVAFRVRSDEFDGGLWTVDQNTARNLSASDFGCEDDPFNDCPYVRADVEQATGVRFHFEFLVVSE
jgi:hypothetical protein